MWYIIYDMLYMIYYIWYIIYDLLYMIYYIYILKILYYILYMIYFKLYIVYNNNIYISINFSPIPRSGQTPPWLLVSDICKSLKHAWYWGCLIWSGEGILHRSYPIDNKNITSMVGLTRLLPGHHRYIFEENWQNQEVKSSLLPSCGNHSPTILEHGFAG
jgi:hypothetical protein